MIGRLMVYDANGTDPFENLAVEQHLFEMLPDGCCTLYLWQNRDTVVIGRNQNAWRECRVERLRGDGVNLARRRSGGGAVFHDLGNLNFTFLIASADHNTARQLGVVAGACRELGVAAEVSGRNDLVVGDRKVSGCAFLHQHGRSLHHGTLLVDSDLSRLGDYLTPSRAKLRAKGVDSVRSRVANMAGLCPGISISGLKDALVGAFGQEYRLPVERLEDDRLDTGEIERLRERYHDDAWVLGERRPFTYSLEHRFAWGEIVIELQVVAGIVRRASVWTDALDVEVADQVESALNGVAFETAPMAGRIVERCSFAGADDVAGLLARQEL